jgi:malto-oligosyltrehalose trehalohydrolase
MHRMPFGAELTADGAVRFRLWAPDARTVEVVLLEGETHSYAAMPAQGDGWFELTTPLAGAGSLYLYRIDERALVPDPASRSNPQDVHGPSAVVDPTAFDWNDAAWRGRPWHEAVICEIHVGAFCAEGTFAGVAERLDRLAEVGITALELMPVADFPGKRSWGYDGVLQFAPESGYGSPADLKRLVAAAHQRGLMVFLDVVYNHFGPDGNYLHLYASRFFSDRHRTPWGPAPDFDGAASRTVRDFFIHNALYWLEEFHLDGLRFDAVHAVRDATTPDIFAEIATRVQDGPGRDRDIHLVLENVRNEAHRLAQLPHERGRCVAQLNDDVHHCLHVLLTREDDGHYQDYAERPLELLGRALAEGFAYQGEASRYRDAPRGTPSAHLPPTCFVAFLQNHDQIGNSARGERLISIAQTQALRACMAIILLAPAPPLLFMGEEWGAREPFAFFCDFPPPLAQAVREGRLREFARFARFRSAAARNLIPDPGAAQTFAAAVLDWEQLTAPEHAAWRDYTTTLLRVRAHEIVPRLAGARSGTFAVSQPGLLCVAWRLGDDSLLQLTFNAGESPRQVRRTRAETVLYETESAAGLVLEPWNVRWTLAPPDRQAS